MPLERRRPSPRARRRRSAADCRSPPATKRRCWLRPAAARPNNRRRLRGRWSGNRPRSRRRSAHSAAASCAPLRRCPADARAARTEARSEAIGTARGSSPRAIDRSDGGLPTSSAIGMLVLRARDLRADGRGARRLELRLSRDHIGLRGDARRILVLRDLPGCAHRRAPCRSADAPASPDSAARNNR